ncbi:hypothetical protein FAI41_08900 [Acetobacteraceae bacterium]|nr:hypothetical protein FAI41_08900 [Acetobacteraceae bacterium]
MELKKTALKISSPAEKLSEGEQQLWELIAKRVRPLHSPMKPLLRKTRKVHVTLPEKATWIPHFQNKTRIVFFEGEKKKERPPKKEATEILHVLDLHGFTVQEAFCSFRSFMERAKGKRWREVEIITGLGISGKGIIRRELRHWLERKEYSSRITEIFHPPNNLGAVRVKFSIR